jgi:hypothetical protein
VTVHAVVAWRDAQNPHEEKSSRRFEPHLEVGRVVGGPPRADVLRRVLVRDVVGPTEDERGEVELSGPGRGQLPIGLFAFERGALPGQWVHAARRAALVSRIRAW